MSLAPSIISADFTDLASSLAAVEPFATSWHVDVMDGHHVPNLTIGPMIVEAIGRCSRLPQDVHLMITNPEDSWEWYAKAGAARIAFHPDQASDPEALLQRIAGAGLGSGIAIDPDVSVESVKSLLPAADHVIVMSVYPGFSGQRFIPDALPKLAELREIVRAGGSDLELIVDGGVNLETAPACVEAGADVLVSASAVFGSAEPAVVAERLKAMGR